MILRNLLFSLLSLLLVASCNNRPGQPERPNIVFIFTDDNAFEYWGFGGGPDLSPHVDRIAAEGVTMTQAYATAPVCTPSRYSLYTGRYSGRCRLPEFRAEFPENEICNITWNTYLDPELETTIGNVFQKAGYTTGYVGKWHLGFDMEPWRKQFKENDNPRDPEVASVLKEYAEAANQTVREAGFDYAASVTPINIDNHPVKGVQFHNLEWFAKGAIDFLDMQGKSKKPFLLFVNITTHHGPCHMESIDQDVSLTPVGHVEGLVGIMPSRQSIYRRIDAKGLDADFKTAGTVWTDDCIGAIKDHLGEIGLEESTIFIFTTDHNRYDGKATCYQGGVHIPLLIKYPGVIEPGSECHVRLLLPDLFPTLMEAAGINQASCPDIDGRSAWKQVTGVSDEPIREDLFFEFGYSRGVLFKNWKYIAIRHPDSLTQNMNSGLVDKAYALRGSITSEPCILRYPHYFDADQLYNLDQDPDEQVNLAYVQEHAGTLQMMKERLQAYTTTFENPFPVDHVDSFYTTAQFNLLVKNAREIDMEQFYWYLRDCY